MARDLGMRGPTWLPHACPHCRGALFHAWGARDASCLLCGRLYDLQRSRLPTAGVAIGERIAATQVQEIMKAMGAAPPDVQKDADARVRLLGAFRAMSASSS